VTVTVMFSERWVLQIPLLPSRALQGKFGNYGYLGTGTGAYHPSTCRNVATASMGSSNGIPGQKLVH